MKLVARTTYLTWFPFDHHCWHVSTAVVLDVMERFLVAESRWVRARRHVAVSDPVPRRAPTPHRVAAAARAGPVPSGPTHRVPIGRHRPRCLDIQHMYAPSAAARAPPRPAPLACARGRFLYRYFINFRRGPLPCCSYSRLTPWNRTTTRIATCLSCKTTHSVADLILQILIGTVVK